MVERTLERLNRPLVPGLILFGLALVYVVCHLIAFAHGDITRFIIAGSTQTHHQGHGLYVAKGDGFDGQFEYRLGLAPWDFTGSRGGIALDVPFRAQRITYPLLVWLASGFGRPTAVPYAMVAVNVAAFGALGGLGGRLAKDYGRHALWGLALGLYFGFVFSISRDLTELVDATALVAGIVGVRERRWWLAALGFAAAVLSRETSMVVVAAFGLWQLPRLWHTRRPARDDLAWAVPLLAFVLWQAYGRWQLGVWPLRSDQANAGQPFVDLGHYVKLWLTHAGDDLSSLARATEAITVAFAVVAALVLAPWRDREGYLTLSVAGLAALGASLSAAVWIGPADLRVLGSLYVVCVISIMRSKRRWATPTLAVLVAVAAVQVLAAAYHRAPIT